MIWVLGLLLSGCASKGVVNEPIQVANDGLCQEPGPTQLEIKQWRLPNQQKRNQLVREF